jgi:hypothetical protein
VKNGEGISLVDRAGLSAVTERICLNPTATAPIKAGEVLGQILYLRDGRLLGSVSLRATEDIPALQKKKRGFLPF